MCALETAALDIQPSTPQVTASNATSSSTSTGGSSTSSNLQGASSTSNPALTTSASTSTTGLADKAEGKEATPKGANQSGGSGGATSENHSSATGGVITEEMLFRAIDHLDDEMQKDFIRKCMNKDPKARPTARDLLFHPVLFEVHSLKLLAAHSLVNAPGKLIGTIDPLDCGSSTELDQVDC